MDHAVTAPVVGGKRTEIGGHRDVAHRRTTDGERAGHVVGATGRGALQDGTHELLGDPVADEVVHVARTDGIGTVERRRRSGDRRSVLDLGPWRGVALEQEVPRREEQPCDNHDDREEHCQEPANPPPASPSSTIRRLITTGLFVTSREPLGCTQANERLWASGASPPRSGVRSNRGGVGVRLKVQAGPHRRHMSESLPSTSRPPRGWAMEFRVLGPLEAVDDGVPLALGGPKQRSVLAMLVLDANRVVSTDRLVDGLWGDAPLQRAAATLHVYVSNLRKVLEPNRRAGAEPTLLRTQPPGYVLSVDSAQVDLLRFESLVAEARNAAGRRACRRARPCCSARQSRCGGDEPIADLGAEPFAPVGGRAPRRGAHGCDRRPSRRRPRGRSPRRAVARARAARRANPYREHLRGQLMVALYRAGRQATRSRRTRMPDGSWWTSSASSRAPSFASWRPRSSCRTRRWPLPTIAPMSESDVARVLFAATGTDAATPVVAVDRRREPGRPARRRGGPAPRDRAPAHDSPRGCDPRGERDPGAAGPDPSHDRRRRARSTRPSRPRSDPTCHGVSAIPKGRRRRRARARTRVSCGSSRKTPRGSTVASAWSRSCSRWWAQTRFAGVVGPSGSGKSSLARAGLLAGLRDGSLPGSAAWPQVLMAPGRDPLHELGQGPRRRCAAPRPTR